MTDKAYPWVVLWISWAVVFGFLRWLTSGSVPPVPLWRIVLASFVMPIPLALMTWWAIRSGRVDTGKKDE
jgi:hypothetical protein